MSKFDKWLSQIDRLLMTCSNLTTDSLDLGYYDLFKSGWSAKKVAQSILDVKLGRKAPNILGD